MDSTIRNEGAPAFHLEGDLGFLSNLQKDGMQMLARGVSSTGHALFSALEVWPSAYTREAFGMYCYHRQSDDIPESIPWPTPALTTASSGVMSIQVNTKAGGAVWSCIYNGIEFLNRSDYGRLLQIALFTHPGYVQIIPGSDPAQNQYIVCNPTEAGYFNVTPHLNYGSPLVSMTASANAISTSCVPLEWFPVLFAGDYDHPVIWSDVRMGKTVTVGYGGLAGVAQFSGWLSYPTMLTPLGPVDAPHVATACYVRKNFSSLYAYNVAADVLASVPMPAQWKWVKSTGAGYQW